MKDDLSIMDDLNTMFHDGGDDDTVDIAEQLLNRWTKPDAKKKTPSEPQEEDADDAEKETDGDEGGKEQESDQDDQDEDADPQDEGDGDEDQDDEQEQKPEAKKTFVEDDNALVKIPVDGAEHEVSVKDLKRLWGQEASLTRKSQEVASERKIVTERRSQYEAALNTMYQKAVERFKPYAQIDFALAAKNLSPEDYAALKKDAKAAFDEVQYFEQELKQHVEKVTQEAKEAHAKAAEEALKALTTEDSPHHIPGWNEQLYQELIDYGVKMGIPQEQMLASTSAPSFKILWMARQYEKAQKVATEKKTKVVGKKTLPAKGPKASSTDRSNQAMQRLRKSGSVEDAAMTLFERWGVE